jgi:hypothetical protein
MKATIFRGVNVEFNAPTLGSAVALICDGDTVEAFSTDTELQDSLQYLADHSENIRRLSVELGDDFDPCDYIASSMYHTLFGEFEPYSATAAVEVREFFK